MIQCVWGFLYFFGFCSGELKRSFLGGIMHANSS